MTEGKGSTCTLYLYTHCTCTCICTTQGVPIMFNGVGEVSSMTIAHVIVSVPVSLVTPCAVLHYTHAHIL